MSDKNGNLRECVVGVDYCFENARRLIHDAILLKERERIPSALGLAVLAYEEIGKAAMLMWDLIKEKRGVEPADWKPGGRYYDHKEKMVGILKLDELLDPHVDVKRTEEEDTQKELAELYNFDKTRCFYVDCVFKEASKFEWHSPTDQRYQEYFKNVLDMVLAFAKSRLNLARMCWKSKCRT